MSLVGETRESTTKESAVSESRRKEDSSRWDAMIFVSHCRCERFTNQIKELLLRLEFQSSEQKRTKLCKTYRITCKQYLLSIHCFLFLWVMTRYGQSLPFPRLKCREDNVRYANTLYYLMQSYNHGIIYTLCYRMFNVSIHSFVFNPTFIISQAWSETSIIFHEISIRTIKCIF